VGNGHHHRAGEHREDDPLDVGKARVAPDALVDAEQVAKKGLQGMATRRASPRSPPTAGDALPRSSAKVNAQLAASAMASWTSATKSLGIGWKGFMA